MVGQRTADAQRQARRHGCAIRPATVDGTDNALTADHQGNRIDVVVEDGRIAGLIGIS